MPTSQLLGVLSIPAIAILLVVLGHISGRRRGIQIGEERTFAYLRALQEKYPDFRYAWTRTVWRENPDAYTTELAADEARRASLESQEAERINDKANAKARELVRESARRKIRN